MTTWQQWISHPQHVWLRKVIFQIHLWSGIGVGLYLLVVSVTGSMVVYSNELYRAATPAPTIVAPSGTRLTDDQLKAAAARMNPGYVANSVSGGQKPNHAVTVTLTGPGGRRDRLFNPYTRKDLGDAIPFRIPFASKLLELHHDLLACSTDRPVNGFTAILPSS